MADVIAELLVSDAAIEKLGARGVSVDEAQQIPRNANVTVHNPHALDPTTWLIVTGWEAADSERRMLPS